jgi:hypothetical protein
MRLFHFGETSGIKAFDPRPVLVSAPRPKGQEWLNGPLVWAIDEAHGFLYFFPRECPRIFLWPTPSTTEEDRSMWMGRTSARAIAYVETAWLERIWRASLYRYEMPSETFEPVEDVGMWISRSTVEPTREEHFTCLPHQLSVSEVELRWLDDLASLRPVWGSTLHASGIRLRNAKGYY